MRDDGAPCYEIKVSGRMSQDIAAWFGMTLTVKQTGEGAAVSILSGRLTDQAALFGILNRIRDLGLKLISVNRVMSEDGVHDESP